MHNHHSDKIYLYGPPGCGKSTLGRDLSSALNLPLIDLDEIIVKHAMQEDDALTDIPAIFAAEGEAGFRRRELAALQTAAFGDSFVVALGGGALLNPQARALVEADGTVLTLHATLEDLLARLTRQHAAAQDRPLLAGDVDSLGTRLEVLLEVRGEHYASFPHRLDTTGIAQSELCHAAQAALGYFRLTGMGAPYDARVVPGALDDLGDWLARVNCQGPVALVTDEHIAPLYAARAEDALQRAGYAVTTVILPAGEAHKTIQSIQTLWAAFASAHLERGSTVIALGGGVVGDMSGFAASSFLRGVAWVNVPTTLLAMVDSSLGGKTGFDLPQGKNLVGAFYPPRLVLADPDLLRTLPPTELRNGLAETVKHGILGDALLFERCEQGETAALADLPALARRSMAVKARVITLDPFEQGTRQALNLGHTTGHGIEIASDFTLSHGESVAIGTCVAARLARHISILSHTDCDRILTAVAALGLPTHIPAALDRERILAAMQLDKKRVAGSVRFALPERIGAVRVGVTIPDWQTLIFDLG